MFHDAIVCLDISFTTDYTIALTTEVNADSTDGFIALSQWAIRVSYSCGNNTKQYSSNIWQVFRYF